MRILLFNIYFHPDPTGTGLVMGQLAEDLHAAGHDVTVVTTVPHYGLDEVPPAYRRGLLFDERWRGIRVLRTAVPWPGDRRFVARMIRYISFMLLAVPAAQRAAPPDAVVAVWPPLTTGIAAWFVSAFRFAPLVVNIQDVYPDSLFRWRIAARLNRLLERRILRRAAAVTVLSEGMRRAAIERGARGARTAVVPMWTDVDHIVPGPKENGFRVRHGLAGTFVALYAGNLGTYSGADVILDAAAQCAGDDRLRFVIVGRGNARERLLRRAHELQLRNTLFLDTRPRHELAEMLAACDVGLVTLDARIAETSVPSKAFTIMAAGRPVVAAMGERNEIGRVVESTGCGWRVAPDQPGELASLLRRLADDPAALERAERAEEAMSRPSTAAKISRGVTPRSSSCCRGRALGRITPFAAALHGIRARCPRTSDEVPRCRRSHQCARVDWPTASPNGSSRLPDRSASSTRRRTIARGR